MERWFRGIGGTLILGLTLVGTDATALSCQEALAAARAAGLRMLTLAENRERERAPHQPDRFVALEEKTSTKPAKSPFGEPGRYYETRVADIRADKTVPGLRERAANVQAYQEGHNRFGPMVLQYTHNLLVEAAAQQVKTPREKVKILFLPEDGTAPYEMAKLLLARFKDEADNPYKGLDLDNLKMVPISSKMFADATQAARIPDVLKASFGGELASDGVIGRGDRVVLGGMGLTAADRSNIGRNYREFRDAVEKAGGTWRGRIVAFDPTDVRLAGFQGTCINCRDVDAARELDAMLARRDVGGLERKDFVDQLGKLSYSILGTFPEGTKDVSFPNSITVKREGGVEIVGTDGKPYEYLNAIPKENDGEKYAWGPRLVAYRDLATHTPLEKLRELENTNSPLSRMVRLHFVAQVAQWKKSRTIPNPETPYGLDAPDT